MKHLLLIFLMSAAIIPCLSLAQTLQGLGGQSNAIIITTTPPRPGPNQIINVAIDSYAIDLDSADISWFLNNNLQIEKTGQKTFTFKTGAPGSVSNLLIVVKTQNSEIIQQVLNIRPAAVDIIWEAQSYSPPFYKGKALYPPQGTVKVVAVPNFVTQNGAVVDPNTLVYTWQLNGNPIASASGYGKSFIMFTGSIPIKKATITVEAATTDQSYIADSSITIAPTLPKILFYEDNPLLGTMFNKALSSSARLQNQEITVVAIPYSMGAALRDGDGLSYAWSMNNQPVTVGGGESSLAFREQNGAAGTAVISLQVSNSNTDKILQFAEGALTLLFGGTKN